MSIMSNAHLAYICLYDQLSFPASYNNGIYFAQGDVMICMELMDMSLHDLRILVYERLKQVIPETVLGKIAESVSTCTFCVM